MINNEKFKAVGIIGKLLKQSLSPYLHNYWIKKYGLIILLLASSYRQY